MTEHVFGVVKTRFGYVVIKNELSLELAKKYLKKIQTDIHRQNIQDDNIEKYEAIVD